MPLKKTIVPTFVLLSLLSLCVSPLAPGQSPLQIEIDKAGEADKATAESGFAVEEAAEPGRLIRYTIDPGTIAAAAKSAIVAIGYETQNGDFRSTGIGFYAEAGGLVLTFERAVVQSGPVFIMDTEGSRWEATVLSRDERTRTLLLDTNSDAFYLPMGSAEELVPGRKLFAIIPSRTMPEEWETMPPATEANPCNVFVDGNKSVPADPIQVNVDTQLPSRLSGFASKPVFSTAK